MVSRTVVGDIVVGIGCSGVEGVAGVDIDLLFHLPVIPYNLDLNYIAVGVVGYCIRIVGDKQVSVVAAAGDYHMMGIGSMTDLAGGTVDLMGIQPRTGDFAGHPLNVTRLTTYPF